VTEREEGPSLSSQASEGRVVEASACFEALRLAAPEGFLVATLDGRLVATNDRLFELWGVGDEVRAEVLAHGATAAALEALDRELAGRVAGEHAPVASQGTVVDDVRLRDGRVLERHASVVGDGERRMRVAFYRDVTHQRTVNEELHRRAAQQAALATFTDQALGGTELSGLLSGACELSADLLGLDAVTVVDVCSDGWYVRASAGRHAPPIGRVAGSERGITSAFGFEVAHEIPLPSAERCHRVLGAYARARRAFGHDEARLLDAVAAVLTSALARFRAEAALGEREAQLRAVFEAPLDAMLVVGDAGRLVDVNAAACELLGDRREALVGRELGEVVPALGPEGPEGWERRRPEGRATGEIEIAVPGRERRMAEYIAVADIRPGRDLVVLRDVTDRRLMGARLALADRMASVGTLAAGVAHELNNPLAYVTANLSFLAERVARAGRLVAGEPVQPDDADLAGQLTDAVRDARDGCERMRVIIRDLKTFSRADDEHTGPVDVARVVDSAVNMAWNEIKHRARLVKDVAGLPPVHGNEGRLGQLFLNLLVNAAQALPEGRVDEHLIRVGGTVLEDGRIAIEVHDTGCGIRAEHLPRIFDPFFTTKAPGVGTGLGLSICHGIVAALGGEIAAESEVGHGSTFRVTLRPAGEARPRPVAVAPAPDAPRARILVVDDEALVGKVLARSLRKDHDVTVVTSARAALDRLASGERYDLVLSDLLMPEMSGMDLYDELRAKDASMARRLVFLTGGAFTPAAREFLSRTPVTCLEKPFDLGVLRAALARKLSESALRS